MTTVTRMFERTFESAKIYADPFNDVEVDVVFSRGGQTWRVPAFWHGENRWTVRFAPHSPGQYDYRVECTDQANPDLNGQSGTVTIEAYRGENRLLGHGPFRVSANRRFLEHADGTPFFWLADTWWAGLSTRLSWDGFVRLTADRKSKGFTVVQLVAGLKDSDEPPPLAPGFGNEGGPVWDADFVSINPQFFDYADRRIGHLVDQELAPAIVGAWQEHLPKLGITKVKKHWRYVIARYGAYPVFWVVGGEVYDPTEEALRRSGRPASETAGGWTEVGRYLRATDPMRHPVTVHEVMPDELPLRDESVTDFHLFQPAHFGWPSIAVEVARLNMYYARTDVTKPLVVGEIGYEHLAGEHLEDFQRAAFWLGMLNGAAGHSYGADGVWECATTDKPFPVWKFASALTWEEGMSLPGSYQIGLGAKLLARYPWWQFAPHPEWVSPGGTTLLEPRTGTDNDFHTNLLGEWPPLFGTDVQGESEWKARDGNFRLPYAAGIPGRVRFIYIPRHGVADAMRGTPPPTILRLERDVRYRAFYWDPSHGITFDLGLVELPPPGDVIWEGTVLTDGSKAICLIDVVTEADSVVSCNVNGDADVGIVLRYADADNYLVATYSPSQQVLGVTERRDGVDSPPRGRTPVPATGSNARLTAQVRGGVAAAAIIDGEHSYSTPIVTVKLTDTGRIGITRGERQGGQDVAEVQVRKSPTLVVDDHVERRLYDARGGFRGELTGNGWEDYAKEKHILLDAYRPPKVPHPQDWILVLESVR